MRKDQLQVGHTIHPGDSGRLRFFDRRLALGRESRDQFAAVSKSWPALDGTHPGVPVARRQRQLLAAPHLSSRAARSAERLIRQLKIVMVGAYGMKRTDYLFPGGTPSGSGPLSGRQLNRLLKFWVVKAGLDPADYGVESLRRTKALHILKGTGDLQTVRALLGHVKIESTARYLGLKTKADPIAVCRAFDI
jgi:integrase